MMHQLKTDREISEMNISLRALNSKRDKISLAIAEKLGVKGFYGLCQLDLNDPRVIELRDELYDVEAKIDDLFWKIDEAEAIREDDYERHLARKQCNEFLGNLGKEANSFLIRNNLTTITLVEKVLQYPDFLKKYTEDSAWYPITEIEDHVIFVKTREGIAPARKANAKCEDVKVGDLALCRYVRNHLFMIDYTTEGVEA